MPAWVKVKEGVEDWVNGDLVSWKTPEYMCRSFEVELHWERSHYLGSYLAYWDEYVWLVVLAKAGPFQRIACWVMLKLHIVDSVKIPIREPVTKRRLTMNDMSKEEVFKELEKRGAVKAVVQFSGGGDEGGVEQIELYGPKGDVIETLEESNSVWNLMTKKYDNNSEKRIDNELFGALGKPVYDKYYSFAGEFHVDGTVTWDVKSKNVKMSGHVEEWRDIEDEEF